VSAAEALSDDDRPWLLRPYDAALDEDGMMSFLSGSYCRSAAGKYAGASGFRESDSEGQERRRKFQGATRAVWEWLLKNADVTLMVDPANPETSIWAWLVTSGADVLHAVGVKRSAIAAGVCRDLVMDLLGDRWKRFQILTLELPQMRAPRLGWRSQPDWFGFDRPTEWRLDPIWLATRMAAR
jgi:hypothetical protein